MIDVKQAVRVARKHAEEVLDRPNHTVDEIEREVYNGRDPWKITLGFPHNLIQGLAGSPTAQFRSIFVDAESGEPLAVKIRELTA